MGALRTVGLALFVALAAAGQARAQNAGCPISQGYSGYFNAGAVNWFTWNSANGIMLVALANGEFHAFVNVARNTASAFSQMAATGTKAFYQSRVAPGHEALLYERSQGFCPFVLEQCGFLWTR